MYLDADQVFQELRTAGLPAALRVYYQKYNNAELLKLLFNANKPEFARLIRTKIWPIVTNNIIERVKMNLAANWVIETCDLKLLSRFTCCGVWMQNHNIAVMTNRVRLRYANLTAHEIKMIINRQTAMLEQQLKRFSTPSLRLVELNVTNLDVAATLLKAKSLI